MWKALERINEYLLYKGALKKQNVCHLTKPTKITVHDGFCEVVVLTLFLCLFY
uniref:Uncharacterized protein n=1 Tax=Anguilla anguilla TaxID=7936 RepID=A0A0E9VUQ1_ANGAN